jgi:hypothetical protein
MLSATLAVKHMEAHSQYVVLVSQQYAPSTIRPTIYGSILGLSDTTRPT